MSIDQTTPTVGKLLNGTEGRDAIHFALAPVTAGDILRPGSHVGIHIDEQGMQYAVAGTDSPIGIVDPFLKDYVEVGQRFWLFLYPNTITSLRHVWSHPAFVTKVPKQ